MGAAEEASTEKGDLRSLGVRAKGISAPWDFSQPPADGDSTVPNVPTPEGRLLGAQLARLADVEEERLRERFPLAHRRCGDCAFRAGTEPNGCPETLMDAVKALVECVPFYCHKKVDDGKPVLLCAGYALLAASDPSSGGLSLLANALPTESAPNPTRPEAA